MRALVLVVAVLLSAGSFTNANQRYAVNNYSCSTMTGPAQQACYNRANTRYAVESQQELVAQQNAREDQQVVQANQQAAAQQNHRRCESVARALLQCQLITPDRATDAIDNCLWILQAPTGHSYGQFLCYEAAADCAGMKWCQAH